MKISLRSITLAAATLALVATPVVRAERLGTNPRPNVVVMDPSSTAVILAYTVSIALGI